MKHTVTINKLFLDNIVNYYSKNNNGFREYSIGFLYSKPSKNRIYQVCGIEIMKNIKDKPQMNSKTIVVGLISFTNMGIEFYLFNGKNENHIQKLQETCNAIYSPYELNKLESLVINNN